MSLPEYPVTRREQYLSAIAGENTALPDHPVTREEQYLEYIAQNGGGGGSAEIIAPDYSDLTFPVTQGKRCTKDGKLYEANQAIETSEAWTAAHWDETDVDEQLTELSQGKVSKPAAQTPANYVPKSDGQGGYEWAENAAGAVWGGITGTLADQTDLQNALNAKGTYSKPSGGIPSSDMASAVQTNLTLAGTAEQKNRMVTQVTPSSDDYHYPSAAAVYKAFSNIFNVFVLSNNDLWGTVSGSGAFYGGRSVTVTATPASGMRFVNWKNAENGVILSTDASYTFTVTQNISLRAAFVDDSFVPVAWASGTDAEIAHMVSLADDELIDLTDYWAIGDTRTVNIDAMAADSAKGYEAHAAQTIELTLMDATCTGFKIDATNKTPHFIVGMKNGLLEYGQMNSSNTNAGGWGACKRRGWCNDVFRMAIPATLRAIFKQFNWQYVKSGNDGTLLTAVDYFALAPERAIFPNKSYSRAEEWALFNQWSWYQTAANRIKKAGTSGSAGWWWECSPLSGSSNGFCAVGSNGSEAITGAVDSGFLAPFGCI